MRSVVSHTVVINTTSGELLAPARNRKRIVLPPSATRTYSIAFGEDAVAASGITITTGAYAPLILTDEDLGDSINQQINAIAIGAATTVAIVETIET